MKFQQIATPRQLQRMVLPTTAKVWLLDIETAPLDAYVWGLFDQTVGLNQIRREWTILSFCAKPLGGGRDSIEYQDNRDVQDPREDHRLLQRLWEILDDADFVIAQNGKRFDSRKIRARLIAEGFKPPRPFKVIDTMLMARSVAAFTSNKQEWLSEHLSFVDAKKDSHGEFPGFSLWRECMMGNHKAWAAMEKYNRKDVVGMEEIYLRLRPWVAQHPNLAVFEGDGKLRCPRCTSTKIEQHGFEHTNVGKYERYVCGHCGGHARGRYVQNSAANRRAQLGTV